MILLRDDEVSNTSRNFIWHIIEPAAPFRRRSPERGEAIRAISSRTFLFPDDAMARTVS
jgi:hypothetical protein